MAPFGAPPLPALGDDIDPLTASWLSSCYMQLVKFMAAAKEDPEMAREFFGQLARLDKAVIQKHSAPVIGETLAATHLEQMVQKLRVVPQDGSLPIRPRLQLAGESRMHATFLKVFHGADDGSNDWQKALVYLAIYRVGLGRGHPSPHCL